MITSVLLFRLPKAEGNPGKHFSVPTTKCYWIGHGSAVEDVARSSGIGDKEFFVHSFSTGMREVPHVVSCVFFVTGTRWDKEEVEKREANKHIWRQKEMISLANFASRSPS